MALEGVYTKEFVYEEFNKLKNNKEKVKYLIDLKQLKIDHPKIFSMKITLKQIENLIREWNSPKPFAKVNAELAEREEREKQKIAYAKKYPYYAVLSCEANGSHANIVACFSGGQYGADTDLNLNGKIFKPYNINQAGDENSNGLAFDLKSDFSIVAQNTSDFLVLKLVITNRLTNKIVYQKEVGQYGVIRISD